MISRRWLLAVMGAAAILSGTYATPSQARARDGKTKQFIARQGAKKKKKQAKEEPKSGG
jgi:hypothetical protein